MKDIKREPITAYVTRYALTRGIFQVNGYVNHGISAHMFCYEGGETAHGKDWHRTLDAAIKRANEMRDAKLKSMAKQVAQLEALQFTPESLQQVQS